MFIFFTSFRTQFVPYPSFFFVDPSRASVNIYQIHESMNEYEIVIHSNPVTRTKHL